LSRNRSSRNRAELAGPFFVRTARKESGMAEPAGDISGGIGSWDSGGWNFIPEGFEFLPFLPAALALGTAFLGALLMYLRDPEVIGPRGLRGYLTYAFPKRIIWHPSARNDYLWAIIHRLYYPFLIVPALTLAWALGHAAASWADWLIGPERHLGEDWLAAFAFTMLATVLARDFAVFGWHRLEHKIWWLWEFHKVHHAAEAMVYGLTARRNHPLNEFIHSFLMASFIGAVAGGFARLWNADVDVIVWLGIDVFYAFELLGLRHLKHSHINLRFPRWLEYVLVSPAQHQVHHSVDPRHWDKNFSTLFAFWDLMFGTWHPSEPRPVTIGLTDGGSLEFRKLRAMYFLPFVKVWRRIRPEKRPIAAETPLTALKS
jgi:sterol desaturase/sphingolipid hydroxylase (fatty acid hydroxylase superfamily)